MRTPVTSGVSVCPANVRMADAALSVTVIKEELLAPYVGIGQVYESARPSHSQTCIWQLINAWAYSVARGASRRTGPPPAGAPEYEDRWGYRGVYQLSSRGKRDP